MKTVAKISLVAAMVLAAGKFHAQSDSLGLPGDNLDLEAVLSIFKKSSTLEDFEKRLNSASEKINNLDLNGDGQVDYLRVVESGKDNFRTIVIQDAVSKTESQDVAVIEIEKKGDETAHIQIVGDETLYGKDYIIEPRTEKKEALAADEDDAYSQSSEKGERKTREEQSSGANRGSDVTVVNVWGWPAVTYMYSPGYAFWVSPWYWGYYPDWYNPWAPFGYYHYRRAWIGYPYGFYGYRARYYAFPHVHHYYYGHRVSSGYVRKTAPNYQRRQTNMNGVNRSHYNRSSGGSNRENINRTQPAHQGAQRTNPGENRVNRGNSGSRPSGTMQRGNSGSQNRGGSQPRQGGGGQKQGGGGRHR